MALHRKQLQVRAAFDNLARLDKQDLIRVDDRRQPVGDNDRGRAARYLGKTLLDCLFGMAVECRRGFVEQENSRTFQYGSGDGDTLLLKVDQIGVACHTGRRSCFFSAVRDGSLITIAEQIVDPSELYKT